MTGIEPGSSGIVSDRSANCATTTSLAQISYMNYTLINYKIEKYRSNMP